jgi:hypothetical protein
MKFIGETRAMTAIVINSPAFLGVFLLFWRRRVRELRIQQAQSARDRLADLLFDNGRAARAGDLSHRYKLPQTFFLYLRPFAVTGEIIAVPTDDLSRPIDLEIRMIDALAAWGPLIALGRPGEARGAGRKEVTEAEWQDAIDYALGAAAAIFILPGYQAGVVWEIECVMQLSLLHKTVFLQPPSSAFVSTEWRDRTRALMQSLRLPWMEASSNRGLLFNVGADEKTLRKVVFGKTAGIRRFRRSVRPFLRQIGVGRKERVENAVNTALALLIIGLIVWAQTPMAKLSGGVPFLEQPTFAGIAVLAVRRHRL